jgi:hypothetical protein
MTEILTESFCERCGTRYTFESALPAVRLKRVKVLSRGLKNFVMSDDTSMDEAMAAARSETERALSTHQLDAFHQTFNFCMSCRQYTCPNCWNEGAALCLSCAPILGMDIMPVPFAELDVSAGIGAMAEPPAGNGTHWTNGLHRGNGADGANGLDSAAGTFDTAAPIETAAPLDAADTIATNGTNGIHEVEVEAASPSAERPAPELIGLTEVAPVDIIDEINSTTRIEALTPVPETVEVAAPGGIDEAADVAATAEAFVMEPEAAPEAVSPVETEAPGHVEHMVAAVAIEAIAAEPPVEAVAAEPPIEAIAEEPQAEGEREPMLVAEAPVAEDDLAPFEADEAVDLAARLAGQTDTGDGAGWNDGEALAAARLHDKTAGQTSGWLQRFRPGQELDGDIDSSLYAPSDPDPLAEATVVAAAATSPAEIDDAALAPEAIDVVAVAADAPSADLEVPAPVAATEPQVALPVEPAPEPQVAQAPEPAPEAAPAPAVAPAGDIVAQPTWRMVAPDPAEEAPLPLPTVPAPTVPPAAATEPQWPTRPEWLGSAPASGLPFLGRPATPQGGLEALWTESNREVSSTPVTLGRAASGVQPCVSCGLSLSASARFCRRCGTLQGG